MVMPNNEKFNSKLETSVKNKDEEQFLKLLDNKETRDKVVIALQEKRVEMTEKFWKEIFEKEFWAEWLNMLNWLHEFWKNIDKDTFNKLPVKTQLTIFQKDLWLTLWEINLYREIWTLRAYLNYDLFKNQTINVEKMLASASEVNISKEDLNEKMMLVDVWYMDLTKNTLWKFDLSSKPNFDLRKIINIQKLEKKDIKADDINFNEQVMLSWIDNVSEEQLNKIADIEFKKDENWKIIITDNRIPDSIKNELPKLATNQYIYRSDFIAWTWDGSLIQMQAIKIAIQKSPWFKILKLLTILSSSEANNPKAKDDNKKILENATKQYEIIWQFKDEHSWFAATILENRSSKDITISIRWSDDITDWVFSNLQIWLGMAWIKEFVPRQLETLKKFIKQVESAYWKQFGWKKITIVWHSLWWSLSELVDTLNTKLNIEKCFNFNWPWVLDIPWANIKEWDWRRAIKSTTKDSIWNSWTQIAYNTIPIDWIWHWRKEIKKWINWVSVDEKWNVLVINTKGFKDFKN